MKTKLSIVAVSILILHSSWIAPLYSAAKISETVSFMSDGDASPEFSFFRTHRQGRFGITATWGLSSENGVQMYSLERTYEDPSDPYANWETICIMACTNSKILQKHR